MVSGGESKKIVSAVWPGPRERLPTLPLGVSMETVCTRVRGGGDDGGALAMAREALKRYPGNERMNHRCLSLIGKSVAFKPSLLLSSQPGTSGYYGFMLCIRFSRFSLLLNANSPTLSAGSGVPTTTLFDPSPLSAGLPASTRSQPLLSLTPPNFHYNCTILRSFPTKSSGSSWSYASRPSYLPLRRFFPAKLASTLRGR